MKEFNSNYLGMVINSSDPEYRGRVQIFIPHIMPTLYDGWNKEGEDIEISCVGSNIPQGLSPELHARLVKILPWAEAASPIVGSSSPGSFFSDVVQGVKSAAGAVVAAAESLFVQTPTAKPTTVSGPLGSLYTEASQYLGSGDLAARGLKGFQTGESQGACARSTVALLGAMTGDKALQTGSAGGNAGQFALGGNLGLPSSSFQPKQPVTSDYINNPSQWKPGDTIACQNNGVGHIFTYTGVGDKPWSSDFASASPQIGSSARNCALHQPTPEAQNKISANLNRLYGQTPPTTQPVGDEQTSASGTSASPNPIANAQATTSETAPTPQTTITVAEGAGISGTVSGKMTITEPSTTIADSIFNSEARLDKSGNLQVYNLPGNDGGGSYEVAGINEKYHGPAAAKLKGLIEGGQQEAAKSYAKSYIMDYTKTATKLSANSGTEYALRDITFNRGAGGANWMAKKAAGLSPNLKMSDVDRAAILEAQQKDPKGYLQNLRLAASEYESTQVGIRANLNKGLENRFNKRLENSLSILDGNVPMTDPSESIAFEAPEIPTTSVVNNTDSNGRTPVVNTNDMANGLFTFPKPGSMVWVFFREGNPLFPVYFAASYSSAEWSSAYRGGSKSEYDDHETPGVDISTTNMKLNPSGGLLAKNRLNLNDPLDNESVFSLYHGEGSNITFKNGCDFHYSKNNKRDEVESDRFVVTKGYKEQWVEGDESSNVRGNVIVKIGKIDQEAIDAMNELADFNKELSDTLKQNS
jgi:hypothetical protein